MRMVGYMKENGITIIDMGVDMSDMQMVMSTMVSFRKERHMVREGIYGLLLEKFMMVNGYKELDMEMVYGKDCKSEMIL